MNPGKTLIGIAIVFGALFASRLVMHGGPGFDAHAQPSMKHGGMMGHNPWMNDSDWDPRSMREHRGSMGGMRGMGSINGKLPVFDAAALPAADSPGAKLMASYCTQCHNLPSPAMHGRDDWPTILDRMYRRLDMMEHRSSRWMSVKAPSWDEKQQLAGYIAAHAMRPYARRRRSPTRRSRPCSEMPAASVTACPIQASTRPSSGRVWWHG